MGSTGVSLPQRYTFLELLETAQIAGCYLQASSVNHLNGVIAHSDFHGNFRLAHELLMTESCFVQGRVKIHNC